MHRITKRLFLLNSMEYNKITEIELIYSYLKHINNNKMC